MELNEEIVKMGKECIELDKLMTTIKFMKKDNVVLVYLRKAKMQVFKKMEKIAKEELTEALAEELDEKKNPNASDTSKLLDKTFRNADNKAKIKIPKDTLKI